MTEISNVKKYKVKLFLQLITLEIKMDEYIAAAFVNLQIFSGLFSPRTLIHIFCPKYHIPTNPVAEIAVDVRKLTDILLKATVFSSLRSGVFCFDDIVAFYELIVELCGADKIELAKSMVDNFRFEYKIDSFYFCRNRSPYHSHLRILYKNELGRVMYGHEIKDNFTYQQIIDMKMYPVTMREFVGYEKCYRIGIFDIND